MKKKNFNIAVAGKGGTGKTTIASLIIRMIVKHKLGSLLCIDADSNATLAPMLGFDVKNTLGTMREAALKEMATLPPGMTKQDYLEYKLNEVLYETKDFDILVMGRPEGPGCYCYVNHVLRGYIDILAKNYDYLVMDNEAGMEHISRRTTQDVDILLTVSDYSPVGVKTAKRLKDLIAELEIRVEREYLILNRAPNEVSERIMEEIEKNGLNLLGTIPDDEIVSEFIFSEKSLLDLPDDSKAVVSLERILLDKIRRKEV